MPKSAQPKTADVPLAIDALETLIAFLSGRGEPTGAVDLIKLLARLRSDAAADNRPEALDDQEEEDAERWSSVPTRRDRP